MVDRGRLSSATLIIILTTFAFSVNREDRDVLLLKKVPQEKYGEIIGSGLINVDLLQQETNQGKALQIFEIQQSAGSSHGRYVAYFSGISMGNPHPEPEIGGPDFTPLDGSLWLVVVNSLSVKAKESNVITIPDMAYGLLSENNNRLDVDLGDF